MHSKCEQAKANQEEKQQLGKTTFYYISIIFSECGCMQISSALVGEFKPNQISFTGDSPQSQASSTEVAGGTPPFQTRSVCR